MTFAPSVAIVTGASRGIGRATATALTRRGVHVALVARDRNALAEVETTLHGGGARLITAPADVRDAAEVEAIVEAAERNLGPIDLLVNNAGVVLRRPVVETEEADWDLVLDVNLKGAFLCTKAVLPSMIARKRGRIVNVSSISGTLGTPELSAYCASKWGLIGFTKATAEEVRPHGVQIYAVSPGSVNTAMLREGSPGAEPDMEPDDVAQLIVYLATDAPDAMTGAAVDVFG